jgi:outer membrane lipoprotein SlyB
MVGIEDCRVTVNRLLLSGSALGIVLAAVTGCDRNYSPNTYSANAVQQANKVDAGVIVGVRRVDISAPGTTGALAGAAVGGIAGTAATDGSSGVTTALTALGGGLVGGLLGTEVEHKVADTFGYEYIVRRNNGDMVSVTQKDDAPLSIGLHVLVIAGPQARIVPDYTVPLEADNKDAKKPADKADAKPETKVDVTIRLAPDTPPGKLSIEPTPAALSTDKPVPPPATDKPTDAGASPSATAPPAPAADKPAPPSDAPVAIAPPPAPLAPGPSASTDKPVDAAASAATAAATPASAAAPEEKPAATAGTPAPADPAQ